MTTKTAAMFLEERKNGLTYREIAEKYGVSQQTVSATCRRCPNHFRAYKAEEVIYPNLRKWLNENKVTRQEFAYGIGVRGRTPARVVTLWFRGQRYPQKKTIDKMLEFTGLTYEELFEEE